MVDLDDKGFGTRAVHGAGAPDPVTGAVVPADLAGQHLRPGGRRQAPGLRVQPQRQPHPRRARGPPRRPRARRRTASPSRPGWPPRTRCCACSRPATTCCCPTTPTAARSAWPSASTPPPALGRRHGRPHRPRRRRGRVAARAPAWCGSRRRATRCCAIVDIEAVSALAHARGAIVGRRQHLRHPGPAATARPRRRRRRALDHQVPRWPQRRGRAGSRPRTTTTWPSASASSRTRPAPCPGPLDCYLVHRGAKTLAAPHGAAQRRPPLAVAELLAAHPRWRAVHYPGLPSHPGHAVAARQMSALRRHGVVPARRRRGGRPRGVPPHRGVHAGREPRRGGEPHRAPRPDDPRLGGRHRATRCPATSCACRSASRTSTTCSPTSTQALDVG